MKWIEENWFKVSILLILLILSLIYLFVQVHKHNLDVVNNIRLCANLDNDEAVKDCANAVKRQKIKLFSSDPIENPFRKSFITE